MARGDGNAGASRAFTLAVSPAEEPMTRTHAFVLAVTTAAALAPAAVSAQQAADGPALAPQPPLVVEESELAEFARVWRAVAAVRDRWRRRLEVPDEAERRRAMAEANAEMRSAVEASTLSVARYNELVVALQGDPGFRRRVVQFPDGSPPQK
jgi:type IV secretory pathway VirB10-like protein